MTLDATMYTVTSVTTTAARMATRDIRSKFSSVVEDVAFRGKRVIVTSNDRDRCAMVSMEDLAKLEAIEAKAAKRRK